MINFKRITLDNTYYIDYIIPLLNEYALEFLTNYLIYKEAIQDSDGVEIILTLESSQPIGFIFGNADGVVYIYVDSQYRRKTIGTRLLILLEKQQKQKTAFFKNKLQITFMSYPGDPGFVNFFHHYFTTPTDSLIAKVLNKSSVTR